MSAALGFLLLFAVLLRGSAGGAQSSDVPAPVQAALLAKLASYDRNFFARAQGVARVVILEKKGNGRSRLIAESFKSALSNLDRLGGLPHEERIVEYENPTTLKELCSARRIAVIYLTPGLDGDVEGLSRSLAGMSVLTVSPIVEQVDRGVVLGFELISGKPRLILNLPQAKAQHVDFRADVLSLMKVRQ